MSVPVLKSQFGTVSWDKQLPADLAARPVAPSGQWHPLTPAEHEVPWVWPLCCVATFRSVLLCLGKICTFRAGGGLFALSLNPEFLPSAAQCLTAVRTVQSLACLEEADHTVGFLLQLSNFTKEWHFHLPQLMRDVQVGLGYCSGQLLTLECRGRGTGTFSCCSGWELLLRTCKCSGSALSELREGK